MRAQGLRILLVAAATMSILGCGEEAQPPIRPPATVAVKEATRRAVEASVSLTGTVEAERTARLAAQVEGEVLELAVREGDPVRPGQLVVRVDPSRVEAALQEVRAERIAAEADLADAKRVLDRDRVLFERKGIGQEQLERSETAVARLEAAVARAGARIMGFSAQLADCEVRAPFEGFVLERQVELGDVIRAGSPLLSVASHRLLVLVSVSEIDFPRLSPGDEVVLTAAAGAPSGNCAGRLSRIRPRVDPATRTAAVEVIPSESCSTRLLPGMLIRATFTLARREAALSVPAEAVVAPAGGGRVVFVVEGDVAARRLVTTGLEGGGWIEITGGLKEGDQVVVQGQERLRDGARVQVRGGQH